MKYEYLNFVRNKCKKIILSLKNKNVNIQIDDKLSWSLQRTLACKEII